MRRIARGLLSLLVCGVLAWVVATLWSAGLAEHRSRAVLAQVEGDPVGMVDFARIGPADWERVYFFHPYTPLEYIHQTLGFDWADADCTSIESNDGVNLVVFVRGRRVVGWFEHPRNRGDLTELASPIGFPRNSARFQVSRDREGRAVLFP